MWYNIIAICFLISTNLTVAQTNTTSVVKNFDTSNLGYHKNILDSKMVDSFVVSFDKTDEIISTFKKERSFWDVDLSSLVALLAVGISGYSVIVAARQNKATNKAQEDNLKSQESQAKEQLQIARDQIRETSKMTLAQVSANNISQARINWIQDLRVVLSEFVGEIAGTNFHLMLLEDDDDSNTDEEKDLKKELLRNLLPKLEKIEELAFKSKLFLNPNEKQHRDLESEINKYIGLISEKEIRKVKNSGENVLKLSRIVLKSAWEQAKKETEPYK